MTQLIKQFRALDFFLIRAPILTFDLYAQCFPTREEDYEWLRQFSLQQLIQLSNNPIIREAIEASSPSLLEALPSLNNFQYSRKQRQVLKGFVRYLLRMTTRPTPFGLFSGVTYGQFASRAQLNMKNIPFYRKRTRPDMEWLLKIIEQIEKRHELVQQLRVQRNSLIYRHGKRAKIPYTSKYGSLEVGENDSVSVRVSEVFEAVMEACKSPILYSQLVSKIHQQFSKADLETIHFYIWQLFEQEFIISELRPPTTTTEPFNHVLEIINSLKGIDELKETLYEIRNDLQAYDESLIGQGEEKLRQIRLKMNALAKVKMAVQIDLSLEDRSIALPEHIRLEVEQLAHLLGILSTSKNQHLEEYRAEFIVKYGAHREIPLLELLDEEIGLGAPATYRNPQSHIRRHKQFSPHMNTKIEQLLFQWFITCIHQGEEEVVLTEERIIQILENYPENQHPPSPSMELYFHLHAENQEALDSGSYTLVLGPNPGSNGAGKTFGRFIDLLGVTFKDKFKEIHQKEQNIWRDKIIAEISYLPGKGRTTNVALTESFREYEIGIGTNYTVPEDRQIHVSDLVVGVRNEKFYLRSRKHNREVIPVAGHMLNYQTAPNIYRFLIEMSREGCRQWSSIECGVMEHSPLTPRLRYKNVVLSPASWRIKRIDRENKDVELIVAQVRQFRLQWRVPRYVYMIQRDNRILLDMDHPLHVEEICKDLLLNGYVTLLEHIGGLNGVPINRSDGGVTAEFVFPLVRTMGEMGLTQSETAAAISNETEPARSVYIDEGMRVQIPGGMWFYAKLYGLDSRQDEFIGLHWGSFVQKCIETNVIEHGYFIRYSDPDKHVRVRFKMKNSDSTVMFVPFFHEWTSSLLRDGFIAKVVIDTYEPEIERYGGPDAILLAEQMFASDSDVTADLVRLFRFNQTSLPQEIVAVCSIIQYLRQFEYNNQEIYELLNKRFDSKEYLDEFRKNRKLFLQLLGAEPLEEKLFTEGKQIFQISHQREASVKRYQQAILNYEQKGMLMNTREDIVFSVIHMHINRLLGIERNKEQKVMILARHAMHSLVQYSRMRK